MSSTASATAGPCTPWIDGDDVAACDPPLEGVGSDATVLDAVAYQASQIMYELGGRLMPGECERTVRPCRRSCSCWTGGYGTWRYDGFGYWRNDSGGSCGCGHESYVKLAGIPVREILEVKIDGDVLDPSGYRLDDGYHLIRMADPGPPVVHNRWPACQNLDLDDDQPGTFSISYTWGQEPTELGKSAAAQLARELWKLCTPGAGTCALPGKVTRIVRQGVTVEKVVSIAEMLRMGSTGLQFVDAFIATVNPSGMQRRPAVYSPDVPGYGRTTG